MSRLSRFFLVLIVLLDVAVFPFSCPGKIKGSLRIVFLQELVSDEGEITYERAPLFRENSVKGFEIGDTIEEDFIVQRIEDYYDKTKISEYSILKYRIYNHDKEKTKEIELPYKITESDQLVYYAGQKKVTVLEIVVSYKLQESSDEA